MKRTPTYAYDTDVVMDGGAVIRTTVTNSGDAVKRYLREVRAHGRRLTVGLDTEWRVVHGEAGRANRMAVLQLCVGRRCLVFQIARADYVPAALRAFLACPDHSFAGVAVGNDAERLHVDCGIAVAGAVDLRHVAAEVLARPELRGAGLKTLAREVRYASIDAFVSYEVGRLLLRAGGAAAAGDGASATLSQFVSFELP
ncbi:hypothetical protein PVAP13_5KG425000 [Panicum virgatum]|uniref:3'-5' exonuclease domain-containing protein n=1 Tax=Panicum virgatum TaxID=38727 RepID=A0A8T0STX3_PANVG|nr:hypothetical protein PVAP13_5KG425000 [Panicum virgatum]